MNLTSFSSLKHAHLPSMIIMMQCSLNGEFSHCSEVKISQEILLQITKKTPINKFKEFLNFLAISNPSW
jgi:hypothetical protein